MGNFIMNGQQWDTKKEDKTNTVTENVVIVKTFLQWADHNKKTQF